MMTSLFKQIVVSCIAAAIGFGVSLSVAAAPLVVGVDTAFIPFEFKKDGEYVGFDIDMWQEIAEELDLDYELRPLDFNGILSALQTKNIDLALAGITITEERAKVIDFSDGYYDSGFRILVPEDSPIEGFGDLKGKTLAVKTGTSAAKYAKDNFKDTELRLFPNIDNAYLELMTGRVDAAMHDTPNVLYFANTAGKGKTKVVGEQLMAHEYGIGFPKGSDLVPEVNRALQSIKDDGRYDAIYKKWFGTEPPQK